MQEAAVAQIADRERLTRVHHSDDGSGATDGGHASRGSLQHVGRVKEGDGLCPAARAAFMLVQMY